jgi:hypothetical protein
MALAAQVVPGGGGSEAQLGTVTRPAEWNAMKLKYQGFLGCGCRSMSWVRGRRADAQMADLDRWCRNHLGAPVQEVLFRDGYLSSVAGVRLSSGEAVVVKVRPRVPRLRACWAVHCRLFEQGFPCPEPLVGFEPFGEFVATAEAVVTGGALFPDSGRAPGPFAQALAWMVAAASDMGELPSLDPSLPWTAPDFGDKALWPPPDDCDLDLNTVAGLDWIDCAGAAARARLGQPAEHPIVGHGDWYTGNLRWRADRVHVAYDWDSVIATDEATVVGLAAAVYPATGAGTEATIEETEAFLDAYCAARGRPFSRDQRDRA